MTQRMRTHRGPASVIAAARSKLRTLALVQHLRCGVPALCGALLLFLFLRSLDLQSFWAALTRISPAASLALVLMTILATVFQGLRFSVLFPAELDRGRHILLCFAISAGNILLPLRGGEALRPLYVKRWVPETPLRELVLFSVADKLLEAACLLPFILAAGFVFAADPRLAWMRRCAVPGLGATILVMLLLCRQHWNGRNELFARCRAVAVRPRQWAAALGFSLCGWLANYAIFYAVTLDWQLALALLVAVNLSLLVPGLPAGIGPYEAAFLFVGQLLGRDRESLVAMALVSHLGQILTSLLCAWPVFAIWGWPQRLFRAAATGASAKTPSDRKTGPA